MNFRRRLVCVLALLWLGGCAALAPPAEPLPPPVETPAWWAAFGSAELVPVIAAADAQNLDIAAAAARMKQAAALARGADAARWPELSASLAAGREGRLGGSAAVAGTTYGAGLAAGYDIDLWGGQRAGSESAQATWRASGHDRDAVRLAVRAGTAAAWLRVVGLEAQLRIATLNLADAERLLALVEARQRAGAASPLELAQQRGIVAQQRRVLEVLRRDAADSRTLLAVWLGRTEPAPSPATAFDALEVPAFEAGLPSDLLARRPDIARAEAQLAAADADIVVARAAMLPSLSLSAGIAAGASDWRRVLDSPVYSLAAALAAPIFDAGRRAAGRDLAQARREELLAAYRSAIVAAFADAQTALQAMASLDAQRAAQAEELLQARRALAIAESRYRQGADTSLTLLDAQRSLYAAQEADARLRLDRLLASVALYRALGGGWQAAGG